MSEMIELKPCPFCGGEAEIFTTTSDSIPRRGRARCHCLLCHSSGEPFEDTDSNGQFVFKAIEAWNRRVENAAD